jgi:hypothetical protein
VKDAASRTTFATGTAPWPTVCGARSDRHGDALEHLRVDILMALGQHFEEPVNLTETWDQKSETRSMTAACDSDGAVARFAMALMTGSHVLVRLVDVVSAGPTCKS